MKERNISDFKGFKKFCRFTKPRAHTIIELMTDDIPDEWLIDVVKYKKKSGKVSDHFAILRKDMEEKKKKYQERGWNMEDLTTN